MALISFNNLYLGYEGKMVVKDLTFTVEKGDYVSILGDNGSGKSTLIRALLGLKKAYKGEIVFCGLNKNEIGYLPQQSESHKDFPASVYEVVLSGCLAGRKFHPFYTLKDKEKVDSFLTKLNIKELSAECFRELSGGQQQRVLLARALCSGRRLLVLDEPVAGLDASASDHMYDIVSILNKKDGVTVISVSHDHEAALKYSTHLLYLNDGGYKYERINEGAERW